MNLFTLIWFGAVFNIGEAYLKLESEVANATILVFTDKSENLVAGHVSIQGAMQVSSAYAALDAEGQQIQNMVDNFESKFGARSAHFSFQFNTKNPLHPTFEEEIKWIMEPGAQAFLISLKVAEKLQLPKGIECKTIFGDGAERFGYKSFVILNSLKPEPDFPMGIAVCVIDSPWNLLSGQFLQILGKCQCNSPNRVGLYGCAGNAWI